MTAHERHGGDARKRGQFSLWRLTVSRLLVYILPILTIGMIVHWKFESRLLTTVFDGTLREHATSLATLVTSTENGPELEFADEYMPQYSREQDPYFFQIWKPDGSLMEKSYSLGTRELPRRVGSVDQPAVFEATLDDGTRLRAVGIDFPIREGSDPETDDSYRVTVVVAAPAKLLARSLNRGLLEVLFTGTLSGIGITIVVFAVLRRASGLLQHVVDRVEGLDDHALEERLNLDASPVEIQPVLEALNDSLDVISDSVARERRFNSDVAHELRTPIAELRAVTEVAMRWPDQAGDGEVVKDAHDIALQMGSMVESLLQLSRLEGITVEDERTHLDLDDMIRSQVEHVTRARKTQPERVVIVSDDALIVHGSRSLWEMVLSNLIDNALEHSPPGSPIAISVASDAGDYLIRVENEGTGLQPEDARHVTSRLWRGEGTREKEGHFGLGLSIVEAACRRMKVELSVEIVGGRFIVELRHGRREPPR